MKKKVVMGLVLLSIVLFRGSSAFSSEPLPEELSVLIRESLARGGQLAILEEVGPGKVYRLNSVLVNAPIERVWEVITDFERYPEFVPGMRRAKIVRRKENTVTVDFAVTIRFVGIPFTQSYTTTYKLENPKKYTLGEDLEKVGFYKVVPVGEKTLLILSERLDCPTKWGGSSALAARAVPETRIALLMSPPIALFRAIGKRAAEAR